MKKQILALFVALVAFSSCQKETIDIDLVEQSYQHLPKGQVFTPQIDQGQAGHPGEAPSIDPYNDQYGESDMGKTTTDSDETSGGFKEVKNSKTEQMGDLSVKTTYYTDGTYDVEITNSDGETYIFYNNESKGEFSVDDGESSVRVDGFGIHLETKKGENWHIYNVFDDHTTHLYRDKNGIHEESRQIYPKKEYKKDDFPSEDLMEDFDYDLKP